MQIRQKISGLIIIAALFVPGLLFPQTRPSTNEGIPVRFDTFFIPKTLRIDYFVAGNSNEEKIYFSSMRQEPFWGGPRKNLIDPFDYGTYRYCAYDSMTGKLIFKRGFATLFQEWKGTAEAKSYSMAFSMAAVMPFPKNSIRFVIEKRSFETNLFELLFERFINPDDYFISHESIKKFPVTRLRETGDPGNHLDLAIIAEGYAVEEMPKFLTDAKRVSDFILKTVPYSNNAERINIYAVEAPSAESGVDIPGRNIYVNTNIHSSFYTFGTERYMTTFDIKAIYDIAANVPYDAILILVNSKKYGGGGFYNLYAESTVDDIYSLLVVIHEFGHSFAGLGDEYVGGVAYNGFYNLNVEPWEPNLTTNKNFDKKWKEMISPGTPIPTPRTDQYTTIVGMFEGGGYEAKGIYSPMMDCRMNTNKAKVFCPACQEAIQKMIDFYCE